MLRFLNSTPARVATIFLIAQAAVLYSSIRPEAVPPGRPLAQFPTELGNWRMIQEGVIDPETQAILRADDALTRVYGNSVSQQASLFIAAFRSQRNGKAPHSPKNCLPGNGWVQLEQSEISVDAGVARPVDANRYVVAHGDDRSLVVYWYQSRDRTVANEFEAKFWVVADAIRYNRTDTALIRVIVPIANRDTDASQQIAIDFIRSFYGTVRAFLPA